MVDSDFKSGFVAILGMPNVGKSTLLNVLLGTKLASVTPRPQTTRNRIKGVLTRPGAQIVFVDTPGIHKAKKELNKRIVKTAMNALGDSDVVVFVVDASDQRIAPAQRPYSDESILLDELSGTGRKTILALNKVDGVNDPKVLDEIQAAYTALIQVEAVYRISALKALGLGELVDGIVSLLEPGPKFYPDDMYTDATLKFLAAEVIREKLMLRLKEELPYAVAVTIEEWQDIPPRTDKGRGLTRISAVVHVDRRSHKRIVIGKEGRAIKSVASAARKEIEELVGNKVFLEVFVKVDENWTNDPRALDRLGYDE